MALEAKMNEVVQMLSTQNEEQFKEIKQLKDGFAQMLSTQSEQHQQDMVQLAAKNRKLEKKLMNNVELLAAKNGALDAKMEQLQDKFSKKLAEQQKQMMAQFQWQVHSLEQKLKEAEQRAQMVQNELEEIIPQEMDKFREEMDGMGQQTIGGNLKKLNYMWSNMTFRSKSKILSGSHNNNYSKENSNQSYGGSALPNGLHFW